MGAAARCSLSCEARTMRTSVRSNANGANAKPAIERSADNGQRRPADANKDAIARLRTLLDTGMSGSGRLPPERVLADEIGVSRRAVRQALDRLEAEGRVSRQQGRGTFVCDPRAHASDLAGELAKLTNPVDTLEARMAIEPSLARL